MNKNKFLYEYFSKHELGVFATIDIKGKPQAAVIGFGITPELELIFGTYSSSRKYSKEPWEVVNLAFLGAK